MTEKRQAEQAGIRARIDAFLARSPLAASGARVVPLTGDASDRRYFRILPASGPAFLRARGAPPPRAVPRSHARSARPQALSSFVLALHAGPFEFEMLPFVNVARLLGRVPLPIPEILDHAGDLGVLALEDLGDVTLQAHLGAAPATEHAALYRQAVAFIALLQRRGGELTSTGALPYGIAFDVEKLTWEIDFFIKHFVEAYRGVAIDPAARAAMREESAAIVEELAAEPRVLCHRDYHSRNLMLHEGRLFIIDFQDARMGPDTYDLASLLRDSYVDLSDETVDDLIAYFLALRDAAASSLDAPREFRRRFDVMALQRNLKALGTFGYQTTTRGNTVYIQYIPRTLRYARLNLERYPRFARLRELLSEHIEELR